MKFQDLLNFQEIDKNDVIFYENLESVLGMIKYLLARFSKPEPQYFSSRQLWSTLILLTTVDYLRK